MNMIHRRVILSLLLSIGATGCARSVPQPRPLTIDEAREWEQTRSNAALAKALLESKEIHAGQSLDAFLELCTPYRIDFVDRFAFIEFFSVPNLVGLSIIAADGKLASAADWGCSTTHEYFNVLSAEQREAASQAYHRRLFPEPR